MVELDVQIERVKHLPPAWQLLPELLTLLNQPDADASRIVRLITYDPGLSGNVLRVCNTVPVAGATSVTTVEEAIVRLGFHEVYRIVAAVSVAKIFRPHGRSGDRSQLWEHSVTTAVAAQMMARDLGDDQDLIFTAALLHDIGRMVLTESLGNQYLDLIEQAELAQRHFSESERATFGFDHAEVGGRLLERWNFPPSLVAPIRFHHDPAAAGAFQRTAAYISYANLIAYLVGYGYGDQPLSLRERNQALEILQLEGDCLPGYMVETYGAFEAIRSFFRVGL
jgi:putative nucleotidyltransferase with HDIG domain